MDPTFNRVNNKIFEKFCEEVGEDPDIDVTRIVDEAGDIVPHKEKRDDNEEIWSFALTKSNGKDECWLSCTDYMQDAFWNCANLGDDKKSLARWGGVQTPCGQYRFVVNKPIGGKPTEPSCIPKPTEAPYKPGTCSFNAVQTENEDTSTSHRYTIQVTMKDGSGTVIGDGAPNYSAGEGGTGDGYLLKSKLEDMLDVQPNTDHHGMLYFFLGDFAWDTVGGRLGQLPYCDYSYDDTDANGFKRKDYNCYFECPKWNNGISSDDDPNKYCE